MQESLKTDLPNTPKVTAWCIAIAFALVWLFGNWRRDVGGFKGNIYEMGFPFVFATWGDLVRPSHSVEVLILDITIGLGIFIAIVVFLPRRWGRNRASAEREITGR